MFLNKFHNWAIILIVTAALGSLATNVTNEFLFSSVLDASEIVEEESSKSFEDLRYQFVLENYVEGESLEQLEKLSEGVYYFDPKLFSIEEFESYLEKVEEPLGESGNTNSEDLDELEKTKQVRIQDLIDQKNLKRSKKRVEDVKKLLDTVEDERGKQKLQFIIQQFEQNLATKKDKAYVRNLEQKLQIQDLLAFVDDSADEIKLNTMLTNLEVGKKLSKDDKKLLKNLQKYNRVVAYVHLFQDDQLKLEVRELADKLKEGLDLSTADQDYIKNLKKSDRINDRIKGLDDLDQISKLRFLRKKLLNRDKLDVEENKFLKAFVEQELHRFDEEAEILKQNGIIIESKVKELEDETKEDDLFDDLIDFSESEEDSSDKNIEKSFRKLLTDASFVEVEEGVFELETKEEVKQIDAQDDEEESDVEKIGDSLKEVENTVSEDVEEPEADVATKESEKTESSETVNEDEKVEGLEEVKKLEFEAQENEKQIDTSKDEKSIEPKADNNKKSAKINLESFDVSFAGNKPYLILRTRFTNNISRSDLSLESLLLSDLQSENVKANFVIALDDELIAVFEEPFYKHALLDVFDQEKKFGLSGALDLKLGTKDVRVKKYSKAAAKVKRKKSTDVYGKFLKNDEVAYKLIRKKYLDISKKKKKRGYKDLEELDNNVYLVDKFARDVQESEFFLAYFKTDVVQDQHILRLVFSKGIYPYNVSTSDFKLLRPHPDRPHKTQELEPSEVFVNARQIILVFDEDLSEYNSLMLSTIRDSDEEEGVVGDFILSEYINKKEEVEVLSNPDDGENTDDSSSDTEEDTSISRDFTNEEKQEELNNLELKDAIIADRKDFLKEYYLSDQYLQDFNLISKSVHYFDSEFADSMYAFDSTEDKGLHVSNKASFKMYDEDIYVVVLGFSEDINYSLTNIDSFVVEDIDEVQYQPDQLLLTDNEVILIFGLDIAEKAKMLRFNSIYPLVQSVDSPALDGYFPLTETADHYTNLVDSVDNKYEAYLADDLQFTKSKLTFGKLHDKVETDSTIGVEIGNASHLDGKCAILVFGNDLQHDTATDVIPAEGLTLISKSDGDVPIDDVEVNNIENQKSKDFLGFVYFEDLEVVDDKHIVYLNLSSPAGLTKGRYQAVMSMEVFCPS